MSAPEFFDPTEIDEEAAALGFDDEPGLTDDEREALDQFFTEAGW